MPPPPALPASCCRTNHPLPTHRQRSCCRRVENVPPVAGSDAGEQAEAAGGSVVPLSDEELAWQLMQQEEAEFQNRLLAMAGAGERGGRSLSSPRP